MKKIAVLGSTGSIGRQTLDVVRTLPEVRVVGLAAGRNLDLLAEQVREFAPSLVSWSPEVAPPKEFPGYAEFCSMEEMAAAEEADLVLVGTVGKAGLGPTMTALRAGKTVALANKEVLVMAGELVQAAAAKHGGSLLPVDSEHSAIWQCLLGETGGGGAAGPLDDGWKWPPVRRLVLTASGGAFRDRPLDDLEGVTPAEALQHPTWSMGPKITVDSATLMNKGFEVIEARWLFGYPVGQIDVIMHRESIVHSFVEFPDGVIKAQLGVPDMRVPLQYALTYPERRPVEGATLDLTRVGGLSFQPLDEGRYPCLTLALEAARSGGTYPAVLSAADEIAVARFLRGGCSFLDIHRSVGRALACHRPVYEPALEDVMEADAWARRFVQEEA